MIFVMQETYDVPDYVQRVYKIEKQVNIKIKGVDSGVRLPGFTSRFCDFLTCKLEDATSLLCISVSVQR